MLTLVINLAHAQARRTRMEALLSGAGLPFRIIDGVYGDRLSAEEIGAFVSHETMSLSRPEYGCLMSHVKCWRELLASDEPWALVLEDDVHLAPDFAAIVAAVELQADEVAILKLETFLATVTLSRQARQAIGRHRIFELLTPHGGTGCYAVNRKTAAFLLQGYVRMQHAIDIELFFPLRRSVGPLKMLQMVPAPVIQDQFLPRSRAELPADSMIVGERADVLTGVVRPPGKVSGSIKALLRPAYRSAYSAALAPFGKQRVKVGFG